MSDPGEVSTGRVVAFDESTGLGTIEAGDGTRLPFHCVEIADGSRTIAPGTAVTFATTVKLGATEATAITKLPATAGAG